MASLKRVVPVVAVLAALGGVAWLGLQRSGADVPPGTLFGNVEMRQVDLAFNTEGAVSALLRQEGDRVKAGDRLAKLDDATLLQVVALSDAKRDAAKAQLDLLLAGTRPEEIDRARGASANAAATLVRAEGVFARQQDLAKRDIASQQTFDDARAALDQARALRVQAEAALAEAIAGPRPQELEAARAQLRAAEATAGLAHVQLSHTDLTAPSNGVIMSRVVEKGSVVLPTSPVYSLALTSEVWVRTFAPEALLSRAVPGAVATIRDDAGHRWQGHIGYVSPMAEFTPKTVETPELRTQLVYRLRIRVDNPDDALRQGMPVTIVLPDSK